MTVTKQDYESRLRIPITGSQSTSLTTSTGLVVAVGFLRVVIGGRGPYVEFCDSQVERNNLRGVSVAHYYYDEWRTTDSANLKLYHQKKRVDYADYLPGMWYASPFGLFLSGGTVLIDQIKKTTRKPLPTLFSL